MEFCKVRVTANGCTEKPQEEKGFASWAELSVPGKKPGAMSLRVEYEEQAGIVPFAIFESRPHTMEQGFHLQVPVQYRNDGPFTRQKGMDNVDIILLDRRTHHFLDIQVGVVVRRGQFYLTAQKIWQGWIAGSSMEDLQFVPSASEHAYPGADYASIWRGMADVMKFVWTLIKDQGEGPGDVNPALWSPPVHIMPGDMTKGTVMYFNMITGTGSLWVDDNRYFVHFSAIEGPGAMKVLVPMSAVEVVLTNDPKAHKLSVSSCRPVATE